MTERELLIAIASYDATRLAEALAPLTEAERKELQPGLMRFLNGGGAHHLNDETVWLKPYATQLDDHFNDWIARLALGKLSDLSGIVISRIAPSCLENMVKVLADRRPDWAQAWLDKLLPAGGVDWVVMQELIAHGVWKQPESDAYHAALAHSLARRAWWRKGTDPAALGISEYLRAHPESLEGVYRLFTLETTDFLDNKDQWKGGPGYGETWAQAIRQLTEEGLLDRQRVLRASLDGLGQDFKAQKVVGLVDFHEGMAPTAEELGALQSCYADLLSHSRENVVAFAVRMLGQIEKVQRLDDAAYVGAAVAVIDRKSKGMAKAVLAQFQKIGKRSIELLPDILKAVATRGLIHRDGDVQEASLALLEGWKGKLDDDGRESIANAVQDLPLSLRARACALVGTGSDEAIEEETPQISRRADEWGTTLAGIPVHWRVTAGVDAALDAYARGGIPAPLHFNSSEVPVLSGVAPVALLETPESLLELMGQAIERPVSAMDQERILDGISRFDPKTTENFSRLSAPLLARLGARWGGVKGLYKFWLCGDAAALHPVPGALQYMQEKPMTIHSFFDRRVQEIGERLQHGDFLPLLSLPTHEGGWIAPSALGARVKTWVEAGRQPDKCDFIQALLRLAPEGRDAAMAAAPASKDAWARALWWTLTGRGGAEQGDDRDLWLAAARSRMPRERMAIPGIDAESIAGPDGGSPAVYAWMSPEEMVEWEAEVERDRAAVELAERERWAGFGSTRTPEPDYVYMRLREMWLSGSQGRGRLQSVLREQTGLKFSPPWVVGCGAISQPTLLMNESPPGAFSREEVTEIDRFLLSWPHNLDGAFASCLVSVTRDTRTATGRSWPEHTCLIPLLGPDQELTLPAAALLCVSLVAPPGDLSRTAIDVLAQWIGDGRGHPEAISDTLVRVSQTNRFQYSRFCANLGEVARVSSLHAWVVTEMLEAIVGAWAELPKNGHHAMELLLELLAQLGLTPGKAARETLGTLKAGGKAGKLAKQVLALTARNNGAMDEVREMMVAARIARAKRWAGAIHGMQ